MKELIKKVCNYERLTNCTHDKDSAVGEMERKGATKRIIEYFGNKTIRETFGISNEEVKPFIYKML